MLIPLTPVENDFTTGGALRLVPKHLTPASCNGTLDLASGRPTGAAAAACLQQLEQRGLSAGQVGLCYDAFGVFGTALPEKIVDLYIPAPKTWCRYFQPHRTFIRPMQAVHRTKDRGLRSSPPEAPSR